MERNLRFEPLDPDALRTRKPVQTDALDGRVRGADGQERVGSWRRLSLGLEAAIPSSAELVERLRALLQAGDGEAIDVVQAHRASLQRLLGATSFRAMESELERFALEAAAAVLEAMIEAGSGRHFDPSVVRAFLSEAETFRAIAQRFQDE
jgi:hypothetical protein